MLTYLELTGKEEHQKFLKKFTYSFYEDNVIEDSEILADYLLFGLSEEDLNFPIQQFDTQFVKSYLFLEQQKAVAVRREFHLFQNNQKINYSHVTVVDRAYQNQGLGKTLLEKSFLFSLKNNFDLIVFDNILSLKAFQIIQNLAQIYKLPVYCFLPEQKKTLTLNYHQKNNNDSI